MKNVVIFATPAVANVLLQTLPFTETMKGNPVLVDISSSATLANGNVVAVKNADLIFIEYGKSEIQHLAGIIGAMLVSSFVSKNNEFKTPGFIIIYNTKLKENDLLLRELIHSTKDSYLVDLFKDTFTERLQNIVLPSLIGAKAVQVTPLNIPMKGVANYPSIHKEHDPAIGNIL